MSTTEQSNLKHEPDLSSDDVVILVMGDAATGKSTFIKTVTDIDIPVGNAPQPLSPAVRIYPRALGDGRRLIMVETPGFGNAQMSVRPSSSLRLSSSMFPYRSDADVLAVLSSWLAASYRKQIIPRGILFLHRVTDEGIGDTAKRLNLYRRLWGEQCLANVIFVTTMWDVLQDAAVGDARVRQLKSDPLFWGPSPLVGTRVMKFIDRQSGLEILRSLENNDPILLRIQTQLVDEHYDLVDTAAGRIVQGDLRAMRKRYERLVKEQHAGWFRPLDESNLRSESLEEKEVARSVVLWNWIRQFLSRG